MYSMLEQGSVASVKPSILPHRQIEFRGSADRRSFVASVISMVDLGISDSLIFRHRSWKSRPHLLSKA